LWLAAKRAGVACGNLLIHVDLGAFQQFENNVGIALLACPEKGGISTIIFAVSSQFRRVSLTRGRCLYGHNNTQAKELNYQDVSR
jgi:hypothetical protein